MNGGMQRTARVAPGGFVYHVLNRSVGRMHMFRKESDFEAFERVMVDAHLRQPIRILSYCVLSNHWHFVAWPEEDCQLTDFFRRLAHTHAMRWRVSHRPVGYGHLSQGKMCRSWAWSTPFVRSVGRASQASLGRTPKA